MKYAKKDSKNDLSMLPVAPVIINTPISKVFVLFLFYFMLGFYLPVVAHCFLVFFCIEL